MYATPILQPTTPVAHLNTGLAIYAYLPMNPCRLQQPSPADRLFFTDASGESALTPITGGATLQLTHTGGHYNMDHHTGHTTYRASVHAELGAMADAIAQIAAHLPAQLPHIFRVLFVVDDTVDTHLLLRIARQPLHQATATSLGTQALLLWKALRSLPPCVQLHIVKQESNRHQYGNGKVDKQAVHQRITHLPTLQVPDLGRNHTHLQHIPPKPKPHRTPDWVPEDAPHTSETEHTITPTLSNISPACSATQTAGHTSRSSRRNCKFPSTTRHCPQQTSQPTSKNDASSSSGSNYHSSRGSADGSSTSTSTSRKNEPAACATTPTQRTGNTSKMPPLYRQGHASGLVPGRNPTATRRLANPQPRTPGHRTPLQGSPGQKNYHERGGDTGHTSTPRQTHGKPNGGSRAPPARSSPQSSGPNGTPQTPPVDTHRTTHRPHCQGTHAASHPLPCRA